MSSRIVKILIVLVVIGGAIVIGVVPRLRRHAAVAEETKEATSPRRVVTQVAKTLEGSTSLTLPGSANAYRTTSVYAKANGFVRAIHVDLGDRVHKGQLLLELDVPETDEQLRSAQAQVEAAETNVNLFESNASRTADLTKQGVVSTQQAEQAQEQVTSARAAVKTSRAELQRVGALRGYQRVLAPFSGVVSRRAVEIGQLVSVGSAGTAGLLIEISEVDRLRVFFDVPQSLAGDVRVGQKTGIFLTNDPTRVVEAEIIRTSGALDPNTRTLRAEVDIDGTRGILAGSFVSVKVTVPRKKAVVVVPASALAIRREGPRVARVVGKKIAWVPVAIGRDLGKEVELSSGISSGDVVVLNPPDDLAEQEEVRATDREKS